MVEPQRSTVPSMFPPATWALAGLDLPLSTRHFRRNPERDGGARQETLVTRGIRAFEALHTAVADVCSR